MIRAASMRRDLRPATCDHRHVHCRRDKAPKTQQNIGSRTGERLLLLVASEFAGCKKSWVVGQSQSTPVNFPRAQLTVITPLCPVNYPKARGAPFPLPAFCASPDSKFPLSTPSIARLLRLCLCNTCVFSLGYSALFSNVAHSRK